MGSENTANTEYSVSAAMDGLMWVQLVVSTRFIMFKRLYMLSVTDILKMSNAKVRCEVYPVMDSFAKTDFIYTKVVLNMFMHKWHFCHFIVILNIIYSFKL